MLSRDIDERLFAKKVEVVADGICDGLIVLFFKDQRAEAAQSAERKARRMRRIGGGFNVLVA
jgi:glutathione S-transferase